MRSAPSAGKAISRKKRPKSQRKIAPGRSIIAVGCASAGRSGCIGSSRAIMTAHPSTVEWGVIEADDVAKALHALFIAVEGTQLRQEERKKAIEVTAFLRELAPRFAARAAHGPRGRLLVDAAAAKSS